MAKRSDENLGWLVLVLFYVWLFRAENPPDWAVQVGWMLGVVLAGLFLAMIVFSKPVQDWFRRKREQTLNRTLAIDGVDELSGHEFERYVGDMLESRGFHVERMGGSADYGADLLATWKGQCHVVQAKLRRQGAKVGPKVVRATIGARDYFGCEKAMVVTNRYFSENARTQAGDSCVLVDRKILSRWINSPDAAGA